jgi:hypothetical protein
MKLKNLLEQVLDQLSRLDELEIDTSNIELYENPNTKSIFFDIGKFKYRVDFTKSMLKNGKSMVEFKFLLTNGPNQPKLSDFHDETSYWTALRRSQVGISGTGSPINVFKHVLGAVKKYTSDEMPDYLTFSGDDEHEKIYRFADQYIKKYIGYTLIEKNPIDDSDLSIGEHWFQRKKC